MKRPEHRKLPWLVACFAITTAHAQTSGWLDFMGAIPGEASDSAHLDWIEIQGFGLDGQLQPGQAGTFSCTKSTDRASPALFLACAQGTHYSKVTLDLNYNLPSNGPVHLARLELVDVTVISQQTAGSASVGIPTETVALASGRITYTYFIPDAGTVYSNFDYQSLTGASGTGTLTDSEGDGMPDSWETTCGLLLGANDANEDADGDGFSNLNEYLLGTNPRSGASFFKAELAPVAGAPGTYQLSWNSVAGKTYVVEWSPDLKTPFTMLHTITATETTTRLNLERTGTLGFFRVRLQY